MSPISGTEETSSWLPATPATHANRLANAAPHVGNVTVTVALVRFRDGVEIAGKDHSGSRARRQLSFERQFLEGIGHERAKQLCLIAFAAHDPLQIAAGDDRIELVA